MLASDTVGAPKVLSETVRPRAYRRLIGSLALRLVFLVAVFAAVPLFLYRSFEAADRDRQALLLRSVQDQGRLVAAGLQPIVSRFSGQMLPNLRDTLTQLAGEDQRIRLLFRPTGSSGIEGFYLIAAAPPIAKELLEAEQKDLIQTGILERIKDTCEENRPLALRYVNPAGQEEVLTSLTPVQAPSGCWIAIASQPAASVLGAALDRPYWQTPEVGVAAMVYALMVVAILSIFLGVWISLLHFTRLAQRIQRGESAGQSFAALNRVPELAVAAEAFDGMVERLANSAETIRQAAEENAHALKTPIAVIAQSLEPVRRAIAGADARARRALELIERSLEKLDILVQAARRIDEAVAETVAPPHRRIDLSRVVDDLAGECRAAATPKGIQVVTAIEPNIAVFAGEELLETVTENILDNALSFSPSGGIIRVTLRRTGRRAELTVDDDGPGIDAIYLPRIFERHFSHRPGSEPGATGSTQPHFGLGLWLVRRNIEALGGRVEASNRDPRGLRMRVVIPTA
ncbi:MAG TPA: HAMP domain-containing sensor histidine kinase [Candidatus Cybelea sp.]|nr:HAMP domain-containing sensor histidine kinase [Candidatus Cybelea sp.]